MHFLFLLLIPRLDITTKRLIISTDSRRLKSKLNAKEKHENRRIVKAPRARVVEREQNVPAAENEVQLGNEATREKWVFEFRLRDSVTFNAIRRFASKLETAGKCDDIIKRSRGDGKSCEPKSVNNLIKSASWSVRIKSIWAEEKILLKVVQMRPNDAKCRYRAPESEASQTLKNAFVSNFEWFGNLISTEIQIPTAISSALSDVQIDLISSSHCISHRRFAQLNVEGYLQTN